MNAAALGAKHARHVLTPWTVQAGLESPIIVRGKGSFLHDIEGRKYLDLSSGLVAVNLGHAHPRVVQAIQQQAARLCYSPPSFFNDVRAEFAEQLAVLAPWPEGAKVFFTTGGAEANEDAIKIARMLTGRFKILAAYRSFHGSTHGASALTGEERRWPSEPSLPGVVHFFTPYPYRSPFHTRDSAEESTRAIDHLERVLENEDASRVAALFLEPIVGSNGVIIYPGGYLEKVREICNRYGILLIFDEVMTGFGRTGAAFAAIRLGVTPDLITFAKGVTSAYVPLGGVLVRRHLAQHFDHEVLWCGHTYSGHPLAMAAGLATVRTYIEEGLFDRAQELEGWLRGGLGYIFDRHEVVGDVRGIGALFGIELVEDREIRRPLTAGRGLGAMRVLFAALRKKGVYAFGKGNVVIVAPSLTISRDELDQGLDALNSVFTELSREELLPRVS